MFTLISALLSFYELEAIHDNLHDIRPLCHSTHPCNTNHTAMRSSIPVFIDLNVHTNVSTREGLSNWSNDLVPNDIAHHSNVFSGERVLVHECVHRREDICRRGRRECAQKGCL